jgi:hypothetical protein
MARIQGTRVSTGSKVSAAAADSRNKEAEEESPASEDEDDEEAPEVEVVERIPKKAKLKDDKAYQEEDSDDDSLAGAGDKSLSLVKHVSRSTPPPWWAIAHPVQQDLRALH